MGESSGLRGHNLSARTLFVAVTGFGFSALVTSAAALGTSPEEGVYAAILGSFVVVGIAAAVTLFCATRMTQRFERIMWGLAGSALVSVAVGSAIQLPWVLRGGIPSATGASSALHIVGALLLMGALISYPLQRRSSLRLDRLIIETLGIVAALGAVVWMASARGLVIAAIAREATSPQAVQQYLLVLMLMAASAVFCGVAAVRMRRIDYMGPPLLLAVSMMLIVVPSYSWLTGLVQSGWQPGEFFDFVTLSGRVLIALAASRALDESGAPIRPPVADESF